VKIIPETPPREVPMKAEIISENRTDNNPPLAAGKISRELNVHSKYCICTEERLVATWEIGKGWAYNAGTGFVNAAKNSNIIPETGDFTLVEIAVEEADDGVKRPSHVKAYELTSRRALPAIAQGDNPILEKITSEKTLSKIQKGLVLDFLRTVYMPDFLYESKGLIHFLRED
jgi:hypothetical protein